MNNRNSSLLYFSLGALFLSTTAFLRGSEFQIEQPAAIPQSDPAPVQQPALGKIDLEEAEKWLFQFFGIPQMRGLEKNLQYLITNNLKDMIFGVFTLEKPLWSYKLLSSSDHTFFDATVKAMAFSNHGVNEAPSHVCFCTQHCRLANLTQLPDRKKRQEIIFTAPDKYQITKVTFNQDNSGLLLLAEKWGTFGEIPKKEDLILYEITLANFIVISINALERPLRSSNGTINNLPSKILEIAYLKNNSIVVVTANKEIFVLGENRKAELCWSEQANKTSIAHVATIDSANSIVYMFIAREEDSHHYPFRLIRFDLEVRY